MRIFGSLFLLAAMAFARTEFWAPVAPPRAHYSIDIKFLPDTSRLEGTETVRFRNDTQRPIRRIALQWYGDVLRVRANGGAAERIARYEEAQGARLTESAAQPVQPDHQQTMGRGAPEDAI
jgi:hypothetical protein